MLTLFHQDVTEYDIHLLYRKTLQRNYYNNLDLYLTFGH